MKFAQVFLSIALLHSTVSNPVPDDQPDENEQPLWLRSGKFEGDILLPDNSRNGMINPNLRWPNRVVPYVISNEFNAAEKRIIENAVRTQFARTCVRITPRTNQPDYVYVTGQNDGCYSYVGRQRGRQQLNLQRNGCLYPGIIAHEFLHATGFQHQQSSSDRDNWVTILWDNIIENRKNNFQKFPATVVTSFGERYDYGSVMHYPRNAFTKNGKDTIVPKVPGAVIGQTNGLSAIDIRKVNKMYRC